MGIRSFLSKFMAKSVVKKYRKSQKNALELQDLWMFKILKTAENTVIGKSLEFHKIQNYLDFKNTIPLVDYEEYREYIEEALRGTEDVFWPGQPLYFAKTSGTTSGAKFIPISKESMPYHIAGARDALLHFVYYSGKSDFLDRKLIFLSGSPALDQKNGIWVGRLSGIVNHHVPGYLRSNQLPSYETNCIEDWEEKLATIVEETYDQDMGLISGIPPWVQMYFDSLENKTGEKIGNLFPNLQLFVTGGVNFEPYKAKIEESIGREIPILETYPASEGFFAFQDSSGEEGLLLLVDAGIFYEFIEADKYFDEKPIRISLHDVKIGVNYALIITTNAGLFAYSIGDTVKFLSKDPYRIVVTGRIKHFISAFGEHVISEEVEKAMLFALEKHPEVKITEFTVAPQVNPKKGLPFHEWFIEFEQAPKDLKGFEKSLEEKMLEQNIYYKDLIEGAILQPLKIQVLPKDSFIRMMKSQGKLGGQNKVPRLANDRKLVENLI